MAAGDSTSNRHFTNLITSPRMDTRMRSAVELCWEVFSCKIGNQVIEINKEASMQLQFAYVLQLLLPLITIHPKEKFKVELETTVEVETRYREIDLMFTGASSGREHKIAIEMKCYKTFASSGGRRGAQDIFRKDVYFDIHLLEQYKNAGHADDCIQLVLTDNSGLVNPKSKDTKSWMYDTSDGTKIVPGTYAESIGGHDVSISLENTYHLQWTKHGKYWFLLASPE